SADLSGVSWAPPNPGGLSLDPVNILRSPFPFPPVTLGFSNIFAYSVDFPIPASLAGGSATLYFDLFDNQNPLNSVGWADNISVIPEPDPTFLGLVGLSLFFFSNHLLRRRLTRN